MMKRPYLASFAFFVLGFVLGFVFGFVFGLDFSHWLSVDRLGFEVRLARDVSNTGL